VVLRGIRLFAVDGKIAVTASKLFELPDFLSQLLQFKKSFGEVPRYPTSI
jgi:hypothetical protein